MILPKPEDALHKAELYRLLMKIFDHTAVSQQIYFKGGSCAAMLGFLDRFSVDLDFDLKKDADKGQIDKILRNIFKNLDFEISQKSRRSLFYIVKYNSKDRMRNSIKVSMIDQALKSNVYQSFYLEEIGRLVFCQSKETMFANKLVAVTDRYKKHKTIAGRDIYDIHYFFLSGAGYEADVIKERTGKKPVQYLKDLVRFIDIKVTDKILNEDLSFLLPYEKFKLIRKILKKEALMFLKDEISRVQKRLLHK